MVVGGRQELGQQIAVGGVYLDAVEAGPLHVSGRDPEPLDDIRDLLDVDLLGELAAGPGVKGNVGLGGEHRIPVVGAADAASAVVVDLHEDLGPVPLYRLGDGPVGFDNRFEIARRTVRPT